MKCCRDGCDNDATKRIHFKIYASSGGEPATADPRIWACDEHATKEAADDLLVDNYPARRILEDSFAEAGLERPDWTKSYAEWLPIQTEIRG